MQTDYISLGAYIVFITLFLGQGYLLYTLVEKSDKTINYKKILFLSLFDITVIFLLLFLVPKMYDLTFGGFLLFVPDIAYMMLGSIIISIFSILFK